MRPVSTGKWICMGTSVMHALLCKEGFWACMHMGGGWNF